MKTLIGKLSAKEGTSKAHHGAFDEDEVKKMRERVNWVDRDQFHVIPMVYRLKKLKLSNISIYFNTRDLKRKENTLLFE